MTVSQDDAIEIQVSDEQFAHLPSGLDICYQTFGNPEHETILLIMGLGCPMGWWSTELCTKLASRGFHVIRFDNRDTGRSTKLRHHHVSRTAILAALAGRGSAPYSLQDMGDDALGLLDHIGVKAAHIVGFSTGGMIAQTITCTHPERVLTLASISANSGKKGVGRPTIKTIRKSLIKTGQTRGDYVNFQLEVDQLLASPAFPTELTFARRRAMETYDRGRIASGVARQLLTVLTQDDRTESLHAVVAPTTVIHGAADPLVHKSGGLAVAEAIPEATYIQIAGMGHDLPAQLDRTIIDAIVTNASRATF